MITGVHNLIYTKKPDEMRAFYRDVLGLEFVDAGGGWQIFALPPTEDRRWGLASGIKLPDGSIMGIYEPRHATAIGTKK